MESNTPKYILEVAFHMIMTNTNPDSNSTFFCFFNEDGTAYDKRSNVSLLGQSPSGLGKTKLPANTLLEFTNLKVDFKTHAVHVRILALSIYAKFEAGMSLVDRTPNLTDNHIFGTEPFQIGRFKLSAKPLFWKIAMTKDDDGSIVRNHHIEVSSVIYGKPTSTSQGFVPDVNPLIQGIEEPFVESELPHKVKSEDKVLHQADIDIPMGD